MSDITTKQYFNTTDKVINVIGVGEIPPHDRVSIHAQYQPPVVLENYPGLVDLTAMDDAELRAFEDKEFDQSSAKPTDKPAGQSGELKTELNPPANTNTEATA
jgi:hypothetical protein